MKAVLFRARRRASFANVTSMLALFIALGGTSYAAATLARDSVGKAQIRSGAVGKSEAATNSIGPVEIRSAAVRRSEVATGAVGASEVRASAIDSDELRDGGIEAADLSAAARTALADVAGVTFRTGVTAAGAAAGGNATSVTRTALGEYTVELARDVSACQYSATLAGVKTATTIEPPAKGFVTAAPSTENTKVLVRIFDATVPATAIDSAFHLLVAC